MFGGPRVLASNNASPFGGGRAVALDAIPTGLVGATTVTTSHLPEQDVVAFGDAIEVTSKRTSRIGKFFMDAYVGTGREQLRGADISDFSISTVTQIGSITTDRGAIERVSDVPFSSIFTASLYEDKRAIDHVEPRFIDDDVDLPLACAEWERR